MLAVYEKYKPTGRYCNWRNTKGRLKGRKNGFTICNQNLTCLPKYRRSVSLNEELTLERAGY